MLTNLIANFCNTFLGRYFENLDTNQLSFSLLQGVFLLNNLKGITVHLFSDYYREGRTEESFS
jgi:hypothetical protein